MDITFFRAALFGACVLLSGCDSATTPQTPKSAATVLEGKTMGTFWRVSVINIDEAKAEALRQKVQAQLDADDRQLSTWKNDSALMRFNHSPGTSPWYGQRGDGGYRDDVAAHWRKNPWRHGYHRRAAGQFMGLWPG